MLRHQTARVEYCSGIVRIDQLSTSTPHSYWLLCEKGLRRATPALREIENRKKQNLSHLTQSFMGDLPDNVRALPDVKIMDIIPINPPKKANPIIKAI